MSPRIPRSRAGGIEAPKSPETGKKPEAAPTPAPEQQTGWKPQAGNSPAQVQGDGFSPPPRLEPKRVLGDPKQVMYPRDLPDITTRFDKVAADGHITKGEVEDLIRAFTAKHVTDADVKEIRTSIKQYGAQLDRTAKARIELFLSREVPHLRKLDEVHTRQGLSSKTATLAWDPPVTHTDGTPLTDLAGYKVHVGSQPGVWDQVIDVQDPGAVGYAVSALTPGPKYFAVTAYDSAGNESGPSNQASAVMP